MSASNKHPVLEEPNRALTAKQCFVQNAWEIYKQNTLEPLRTFHMDLVLYSKNFSKVMQTNCFILSSVLEANFSFQS